MKISLKKSKKEILVGDLIIERNKRSAKRRIGEVIFVRESLRRRFEVVELNRHDLTPKSSGNLEGPKTFTLAQDQCRKLNPLRFAKRKTFEIGDIVRYSKRGRSKFGIIISFVHPDGLYSESYEKGYNGKDYLECIEIIPRKGLQRKKDSDGKVCVFFATPENSKTCKVIQMDKNGGARLEK